MKKTLNSHKNNENWQETLEILRDPELVKGIREGREDIKAGRLYSKKEVFDKAQKKSRRPGQKNLCALLSR